MDPKIKNFAFGGIAVAALAGTVVGVRNASMAPVSISPSSLEMTLGDRAADFVSKPHHRGRVQEIVDGKVEQLRMEEESLLRTTTFENVQGVKHVGTIFTTGTRFPQPSELEKHRIIQEIKRVGATYDSHWGDTDWKVSSGKIGDIFDIKHENVIYTVTVDARDSRGLVELTKLRRDQIKDVNITLDQYRIGGLGNPYYASDVNFERTGKMDYRFGDGRMSPDDVLNAGGVTVNYKKLEFVPKKD